MKAEERRRQVVKFVQAEKSVQLDELAARLGVSRMTIHRDLDYLESRGLLRKERGCATAESSLLYESNFHYRLQFEQAEKVALARAAAQLVEPGNVVMIDDSTTTLAMCEFLVALENVTVITNSLAVCEQLGSFTNIQVILTGGTYSDTLRGFYGLVCEQTLNNLRADWAFLSASSVIGASLFHQDQDVVRMKRALMTAAEQSVLLLTAPKFKSRALNHFADLSEFDRIFVDRQVDEVSAKRLRQTGIAFDLV